MDSILAIHPALTDALASDALWVLVRVGDQHLALPSGSILEMVRAPAAHHVPHAPPCVRGIASMRGQVGIVVDMRTRLGLQSVHAEQQAVVDLLRAREQDHHDWVDDLEASVRERRDFTRTLDPHGCAFGKWYDAYKAPTLELEWYLRQFAEPHAEVHATGATVAEHMRHGRHAAAADTVAQMRATSLPRLVSLFEGARNLMLTSSREIAVISKVRDRSVGLVVDEVEGIDKLKPDTLAALPLDFGSTDGAIVGTARTQREDTVVVVLDLEVLSQDYSAAA